VTSTTEAATSTTEEVDAATRDRLLQQGYSRAMTDLREAHMDEFNELRVKRTAELGIEWTPRPSKEKLALDAIEILISENPGIAEALAERLAERLINGS